MSVRVIKARQFKSRNWCARYPDKADELWVIVHAQGRRKRTRIGPDTPENRERAEGKKAEYQLLLDRRASGLDSIAAPAFGAVAEEFLRRGMKNRAPKTKDSRRYQVKALIEHFGDTRLDRIGVDALKEWWDVFVEGGKRDRRTGTYYLDAVSLVFQFAGRRFRTMNPVPSAKREILEGIENTAEYRSRDSKNQDPFSSEELQKLLPAVAAVKNRDFLICFLMIYECGMRLGEAFGVRYGDCEPGRDDSDTGRCIHVRQSRMGRKVGLTKSGRSRKVELSRRLRQILLERQMRVGRPDPTAWVVSVADPKGFRRRLREACKNARVRPRTPKDLRDTFASQLFSAGVPLGWVSKRLGHGSAAVTARHYAAWVDEDGYRNPLQVAPGELPTDLFAQFDLWRATTTPPNATTVRNIAKIKKN